MDYTSYLDLNKIIDLAANKGSAAIILFSTTSTSCNYTNSSDIALQMVYTVTSASAARSLLSELQNQKSPDSVYTISADGINSTNSIQDNSVLGPSPTTAVAMIILYSITGIITALFLIIIVTGAIRAHRHPERYGPRNVVGGSRQSRAKGIARAMLETLPVVKFGERDENATSTKLTSVHGDIELGPGRTQHPGFTTTHEVIPAADPDPKDGTLDEVGDGVRTARAEDITPSTNIPGTNSDRDTDHGLACSVCTDDFIRGQDIRVLPCGHKFHPECIDPWLLNVSGTCPLWHVTCCP